MSDNLSSSAKRPAAPAGAASDAPAKRPALDVSLPALLALSQDNLAALSKDQLLAFVLLAQNELKPKELSPEELAKKVDDQRRQMTQSIKKQLTWKRTPNSFKKPMTSSCKTRSAKFSHELVNLDLQTFAAVFRLVLPLKKKVYKLTEDEFERACGRYGSPVGKVRYDYLTIEPGVNLRWNEDEDSATVSGKYGK